MSVGIFGGASECRSCSGMPARCSTLAISSTPTVGASRGFRNSLRQQLRLLRCELLVGQDARLAQCVELDKFVSSTGGS